MKCHKAGDYEWHFLFLWQDCASMFYGLWTSVSLPAFVLVTFSPPLNEIRAQARLRKRIVHLKCHVVGALRI
jgi:hypothetical protein